MKISRNAWHYKYNPCFEKYDENVSICKYFWSWVFMIGLLPVVLTASFFIIPFILGAKLEAKHPELKIHICDSPENWVLFEYLKAIKDKMCPLIRIVE